MTAKEPSRAHHIAQIICLYRHAMRYEEIVDLIEREFKIEIEFHERTLKSTIDSYELMLRKVEAERDALHKTKVL